MSQSVPFYGRYVDSFVLSTAGGIFFQPKENDSLMMPSFIAPFLTRMPPSDQDSVTFYDHLGQGGDLVIQWDRHLNNGEDHRLKVQLRLLLDGSMSFVYQNFAAAASDESLASELSYLPLIGIKDGFSAPLPSEKPQGKHHTLGKKCKKNPKRNL